MDIIMNFLALVVVSEFDDMLFTTVLTQRMSKLISDGEVEIDGRKVVLEDISRIETTTSQMARNLIEGNELNYDTTGNEGKTALIDFPPKYIFIKFSDRPLLNAICRVIH